MLEKTLSYLAVNVALCYFKLEWPGNRLEVLENRDRIIIVSLPNPPKQKVKRVEDNGVIPTLIRFEWKGGEAIRPRRHFESEFVELTGIPQLKA